MIGGLLLALIAQQATIDWAALPALPYRAPPLITPTMNEFAGREAGARKCPLPKATGATQTITVELAMLVGSDGRRLGDQGGRRQAPKSRIASSTVDFRQPADGTRPRLSPQALERRTR